MNDLQCSTPAHQGLEVRLWDSQWMNVVNAPEVLNASDAQEAVRTAVRMTESFLAHNVASGYLPHSCADANARPLAQRPSPVDRVLAEVRAEVVRATAKFPTWPSDALHASGVVQEESGELAKAVLQAVYEPHKSTPEDVATEALQTAAMAVRFLLSMDSYQWQRGDQHAQNDITTQPGDSENDR